MNKFMIGMAVIGLAACNDGDPDTAVDDTVDGCGNTIISGSEFPGIDATNAYYRTTVEAKLQTEEADASITLTQGGNAVAGTASADGKRLIFTPDAPLEPSTSYEVTVSYCAGEPSWAFTTSEVGGSIGDAASLEGEVYELDLSSGRFVQPEGVGPLLQEYLNTSILMGVVTSDGTQINMIGAIAEDGVTPVVQAACSPTIPFPVADFTQNPYFRVGPETTELSIEGYTITVDDLDVSGAFAPDGSYISGAVLKGSIDTRPLVPLLNPEGEDDEICNLAMTIGVACEPCADGGNFCLSLFVDSISAAGTSLDGLQAQHGPAELDPPAGSVDICTISGCENEDGCPTPP